MSHSFSLCGLPGGWALCRESKALSFQHRFDNGGHGTHKREGLDGLSFAFSPEEIEMIENHILDGTQWMLRRQDMDMASRGRNTARPDDGKSAFLFDVLDSLILLGTPRQRDLQNMRAHIDGTKGRCAGGQQALLAVGLSDP